MSAHRLDMDLARHLHCTDPKDLSPCAKFHIYPFTPVYRPQVLLYCIWLLNSQCALPRDAGTLFFWVTLMRAGETSAVVRIPEETNILSL